MFQKYGSDAFKIIAAYEVAADISRTERYADWYGDYGIFEPSLNEDMTYVRLKMECKDYILAQKTTIDALRFDPKDSELNMYAILAMGFQGNLSMAQTYYTAAKPYLALEHAEVIKKYLHIK